MYAYFLKKKRGVKMEFYETTLRGMKKILECFHEDFYAGIVEKCIEKWISDKNVMCMLGEFADSGKFRTFKFKPSDFSSDEQAFWTNQLFGGLVAMMIQLGGHILDGKTVTIDFIRKNFGRSSEVLTGTKCTSCGKLFTSALDIDKYVSLPIIAKRIADGLEKGNLDDEIDIILSLSAPETEKERNKTKLRCINTNISVTDTKPVICLSCGSRKLSSCRFLRSVKAPVFVPLNS